MSKMRSKQLPGVSRVSKLKLPFERDESVDNAAKDGAVAPPPTEAMKQAVRDIARGVQDTDRGAVVGSTYSQLK